MKEYIVKVDFITEGDEIVSPEFIGELILCKDCTSCLETKLSDGKRWNYCGRLRRVTEDDGFCCWAEPKGEK